MVVKNKNIYTDLDTLPIYNFIKCTEGKLEFMYDSKKGKITPILSEKWNDLYDKYCELTNSNETLRYYRLIGEIEFLEKRYSITVMLVDLLAKSPEKQSICDELKEWGFKINLKKDLKLQLDKIATILNNSKNKLNRKTDELNQIKNKPKEPLTLQQQKAKLHRLLGINVDLFTTSVMEWIAYWEEVKQLSRENNGK